MLIKGLTDIDFVNYKYISMFIAFPKCDFKCDRECGKQVCQNSTLALSPDVDIPIDQIVRSYLNNNITQAIVCGGLEPFDSWDDLLHLIEAFRMHTDDDIVIYTGYTFTEVADKIFLLSSFKNIIVKFGRFIPDQESHYDEILGVNLASNNQRAEKISR